MASGAVGVIAASGAVLSGARAAASAATANELSGVSCPAVRECVAAGHYGTSKTQLGAGWAGVWNGKTWKQAAAV